MISTKTLVHRILIFVYIIISFAYGLNLTIQTVFVIITFYEILKFSIIGIIPVAIAYYTETKISIKRIQEFLLCDKIIDKNPKLEYVPNLFFSSIINKSIHKRTSDFKTEIGISSHNLTVKWIPESSKTNLDNITFTIGKELVAFIGPAGSGKSTLLYAILQEISPIKGSVHSFGKISYASQEPWIFSGTIKQNILFGQEMVEDRYQKVIQVCALERDLSLFPQSDQSLVGDRGMMLSGGQKARINLARAVYRQADIYLLDDPLSAVDSNVGREIFNNCINNFLKNKCVLLVTHQVQHLKNVDRIFVLEEGQIIAQGKYKDLNIQLSSANQERQNLVTTEILSFEKFKQQIATVDSTSESYNIKRAYKTYLLHDKRWILFFLVFLLSLSVQLLGSVADYVIVLCVTPSQNSGNFYLYIYALLIILLTLLSITRSFVYVKFCVKASEALHRKMLAKIINATMSFFNNHESGKIMNSFSRDIGLVDESIPFVIMEVIYTSFTALGILVLISVLNVWFVIPMVIVLIVFYIYSLAFTPIARSLNILEANSK